MFINESDINDELLKPSMTTDDLVWADNKMQEIAGRLGVEIVSNPSQTAKDLACAYACQRVAERKAGTVTPKVLDNGGIFDMYENKRRFYSARIEALASSLSEADLTGGTAASAGIPKSTPFFFSIARG